MATITVLKFDNAEGADNALATVGELARRHLITLLDAALVTWKRGKKKPKTQQLKDLTAQGALNGAFWGILFGLIFFVPLLGAAMGAGIGALTGSLSDAGIRDDFIRDCQKKVTEGTSALFLMTKDATVDKVIEAMKQHKFEIAWTNLSRDQEEALRTAFAEESE